MPVRRVAPRRQVRDPCTGHFAHAPPVRGAVAVNAGDMLARWSNDVIRSTEHRVVSPPATSAVGGGGEGTYPARYSVAFFCNPNWDAVIGCLDGCHSPERPPLYAPVLPRCCRNRF